MADEQKSDGQRQPDGTPTKPEQKPDSTATSSQAERDRQNRDDPSRAPESGDRK